MTVKRKVGSTGSIDFPLDYLSAIQVKPGQYVNLDLTPTNIQVTKYIIPPFIDGFDTAYVLGGGQTSPDGSWKCTYTGYGRVASEFGLMHLRPKTSTDPTGKETHASLVVTTAKYANFVLDLDMRTNQQLRVNHPAKNWETAWVFFRSTDATHSYYFTLKNQGFEFGKKDNYQNETDPEHQIFLVTGQTPSVTKGTFQHVTITAQGFHFTIKVNGQTVVDMTDPDVHYPSKMSSGSIGLYCEDADVSFDNVVLQPVD